MLRQRWSWPGIVALVLVLGCATAEAGDRFLDNADGTVTDNQLGVMWAKIDNQGDINWKEAQQWVRYTFPLSIEIAYENWRLPTLKELQSLHVADGQHKGYETDCGQWVKIDPVIRLTCGWLWSSDTAAIQAGIFNFHRGYSYMDRMVHDKAHRVLPVRDLE